MQMFFVRASVMFRQGGRPVMPVGDGYAPYVRASSLTQDLPVRVYGLPVGGSFGAEYSVELELSYHPRVDYSGLKNGQRLELIEGAKIVGSGTILSDMFSKEISGAK